MTEIIDAIKQVLDLGAPAVYLILLVTVWREYRRTVELLVDLLREIAKLKEAK